MRIWKIHVYHSGVGCSFKQILWVVYFPVKHLHLYNKYSHFCQYIWIWLVANIWPVFQHSVVPLIWHYLTKWLYKMRNDEEIKHCLMFISLPTPIVAYGFVLFVNNCAIYPFLILHLSMAIQGLAPGNPRASAPRHLQIPPAQGQHSSTKSYHCPFPREHNLKGL